MGLKKWLEDMKKNSKQKKEAATDPQALKEKKKQEARKMAERTLKVIDLAKKGLGHYNNAAKKIEGVTNAATEKALDIAEKAKPLVEKVDTVTDAVTEKAKGVFKAAAEKADEVKKENAQKPTTGSSILDILTPAIPETDATKPKKKKEEPPAPPSNP